MEPSSNNQKYYLHFNGERQGPFTIKEIEENGVEVNSNTLVWTKGMKEWDKAENIKDFDNSINSHLPPNISFENNDIDSEVIPPIPKDNPKTDSDKSSEADTKKSIKPLNQEYTNQNNFNNSGHTTKTNSQNFREQKEINANKKKAIVIVSGIVVVLSLVVYFVNTNAENNRNDAQLQLKLETQLQQQQQIIEDHQKKIQAQQLAERQDKIKQLNEIVETLKIERDEAQVYLRSSEIELNNLQQFHFLRSASEKNNQIRSQLSMIQGWEAEVNRLNNEIQKFQREIAQLRY